VKKKENNMPKSVFKIDHSNLLDKICSEVKFTEKTTLEQIEYLNKFRSRRGLYRWGGNSIMDNIIDDQPGRTINFVNIKWGNHTVSSITFRYVNSEVGHVIRYPINASMNSLDHNGPVMAFVPNGNAYAERPVRNFLRYNVANAWGSNADHDKIFRYLYKQYEDAWLDLKRRKVAELKASLDSDSVNEFVAAKRAQHTQAVMDIAMQVAALTAKLETYRNRIGNVTSAREAEEMFTEVDNAFRNFNYTQERNTKRLNKNVKLPGGKRVKQIAENKEE
jgi:hypothetical protein